MRKFVSLFALSLFIFLGACSDENNSENAPDAKPIPLRAELQPRIEQDNAFAWKLFKTVYQSDKKPNVFISPLSVSMALSMTMNGAKGQTWEEMAGALQISGLTQEEVNEYCKILREALLDADPMTQLSIANSIWYRWGFPVENNFKQINRDHFNAEIKEADFVDPATLTLINKWCADNTNNRIPKVIDEIPDNIVMYLINAVYFKGMWRSKFDKNDTRIKPFYTDDNRTLQTDMMLQQGEFNYVHDDNAAYLELPYGNNAFSMIIMLPDEGKTVSDVVAGMDATAWNRVNSSLHGVNVNVELPRFKAECEYRLAGGLRQMGMVTPFTDFADFTGISRGGGISISDVIHKTFVEVNEEGTEAAAVTAVGMITTSLPNAGPANFIVNKPFLFAIKEKSTGVILFMGKMGEV